MYQNIPSGSLVVLESERKPMRATVSLLYTAVLRLSIFAYIQLFEGASIHLLQQKVVDKTQLRFLLDLMRAASSDSVQVTVSYAELITLRDWLQMRMAHCELERDERSDKFNPDTYIGQKLLLLDIRELLLGEILSNGNDSNS
jgi:hypothetical protein